MKTKQVWQSAGGKAAAIVLREKALLNYYKNPNLCKQCGSIIHVGDNQKVANVRVKLFCNAKCSATYNNHLRKKVKDVVIKEPKELSEPFAFLLKKNKGEVFKSHKNWQSARTSIRRMAAFVYNNSDKPKCCMRCGYDKHYEVCHLIAVSKFSNDTLITAINHIDNLIALCPNCHWEFDN